VIDGFTRIGSDVVISPWVTVGLIAGNFQGPIISNGVHIGTGAKIIGPITIGEAAVIGANAVVVKDVPSHRTVIGIPAEELK
jgi:serine O-acetyltransferase